MDFELDDDQRAILEAVGQLLARHAGPERAIELQASGDYDVELDSALSEAGFYDGLRESAMGPLEAALITEAVAGAAGGVAFAAGA
ncbi:MAG: acyl-CoA dehydrogenase, partial [Deltaproteobacteria bacterium]|nr:acyl-CoA dehydrogenase [Deltaproteobacteria bacterium]